MKKIFIIILITIFSSTSYSAQDVRIAAHVGDDIITTKDIDARINLVKSSNKSEKVKSIPLAELKKEALRMLIEEKIIFQEANNLHVRVTEDEMKKAISDIEAKSGVKPGEFDTYLKTKGLNKNSVYDQIRGQLTWSKIVAYRITPLVSVSEYEVDEAIEQLGMKNYDLTLKRAAFTIPPKSKEPQIKALYTKLNSFKDSVNGCDNLSLFESDYNITSGHIITSEIDPNMRVLLLRTPVGQFTPVIKNQDSLQSFMICQKDLLGTSDQDRDELRALLEEKKVMQQAENYLKSLKSKAAIEILDEAKS